MHGGDDERVLGDDAAVGEDAKVQVHVAVAFADVPALAVHRHRADDDHVQLEVGVEQQLLAELGDGGREDDLLDRLLVRVRWRLDAGQDRLGVAGGRHVQLLLRVDHHQLDGLLRAVQVDLDLGGILELGRLGQELGGLFGALKVCDPVEDEAVVGRNLLVLDVLPALDPNRALRDLFLLCKRGQTGFIRGFVTIRS